MSLDLMSSDESVMEQGEEVITTRPLPWLAAPVTSFKKKLDETIMMKKSAQSRRQRKGRVTGAPSARPPPEGFPSWVYNKKK